MRCHRGKVPKATRLLALASVVGLVFAPAASAHHRHHRAHAARDLHSFCRTVAHADTPGAQTLTVVDENGVPNSVLLQTECAVVTQARALRAAWGTPPIRFGSGGWPVYVVNYDQPLALGLLPIPTGAAGYHTYRQGVPYAVVGSPGPGSFMSATFSHEVMEMLVDPFANRYIGGQLVEVCDPVSSETQANDGAWLSGFVTPAYFG